MEAAVLKGLEIQLQFQIHGIRKIASLIMIEDLCMIRDQE